jgi:purine-nucleoside/S-methyl-5'-thioadenosine phosphorylase / adenosine deaminase
VAGQSQPASPIQLLRCELLDLPWLVHAFSTRVGGASASYGGGALNLGFTRDDSRSAVERNRASFLEAVGASRSGWRLITLRQLHSDIIHAVDSVPEQTLSGDGLITRTPGLLLGIQTADCLPVILADPRQRAAGVFHAGWRGTLRRIVEKGVGEMRRHFGSGPSGLRAAIGPGIHSCCYRIGEEVRDNFASQFPYAATLFREVRESEPVREKYPLLFLNARAPGHGPDEPVFYLDLVEANRRQLLDAGLLPDNIVISELCTSCHTGLLFSHRAEHAKTGRMLAVAGIHPSAAPRAPAASRG